MSHGGTEDLSDRLRKAEEALHRCERLAVASRYAGAVMHEVNNPLEALSNLIFLTKGATNEPDKVIFYMAEAERQLSHLGQIIRKTLTFYPEQAEASDFDIVEILASALMLHAHRMTRQNLKVRRVVGKPAMVKILAGEILQVLSNLILNALDAAPKNGAALCVRVKARERSVTVIVSDNGSGIEAQVLKNLFQPHNTSKANGTGFGLWLSHNIASKHGGALRCRSSRRPGFSGTTFRLTLPLSMTTNQARTLRAGLVN
jgi:C4-dicarboxylate-specific signal transduction histidine kinase